MNVAIVGQGYVGLNIAAGAISAGHKVFGIDLNERLVADLNKGISHIEGISSDLIYKGIKSGNYFASSKFDVIQSAEVVVIAVPTPLNLLSQPDLSFLDRAIESIIPFLLDGALVINESTSYIGTLRNLIANRINSSKPSVNDFATSPERVDPGNSVFDVKNTPRLVGGVNSASLQRAFDFYSTFCAKVIKVSTPEVAEAAKLLENSFRFVNIGLINEFAQIMTTMGIPTSEVIAAASTKPYGFMPFFPNVGVGGHCIPVDPLYLQKNARDVNMPSRYIELSEELNVEMPKFLVKRLESFFGSIEGKHVLVVGVSYKPDIADTRESPAELVIETLRKSGAKVSWHDPLVSDFIGERSSPVQGNYDLGLVLVKHKALDSGTWSGKPIYCVNPILSEPNWIPLLGPRDGQ